MHQTMLVLMNQEILFLDENGNEQIVFYDGFLDRNRLATQIEANNTLKGKRYFMEHRYQMFLSQ
jgi:hypothetical protein